MADGDQEEQGAGGGGGVDGAEAVKCPECKPGLPGWMATFSDMVTLLLTFFVLLLSFAKTESAKYEAALGSIRNAFGGNVLNYGDVIQKGKSPDNNMSILDSSEPIRPFPIDFLTMEGMLDKHEINRESTEVLESMQADLAEFNLAEHVDVYEMPEGVRVEVRDKIYFEEGSVTPSKIVVEVYDRLVQLLSAKDWMVYVMGHSSLGEVGTEGQDAFALSAARVQAVSLSLMKRGVPPEKISSSFYGDSRAEELQQKTR